MLLAITSTSTNSSGHSSSGWGFILVGVLALLIGLLHAAKPDATWRMSRWQYKNKAAMEPSAAGLTGIRIGGFVAVVFGIVLIVIGIAK